MRSFIFTVATMAILFSSHSKAAGVAPGVVFNPSFFYYTDNDNNQGGNSVDSTRDIINLKFGYFMSDGFYLGFVYDIDNKSVQNNNSTTTYDRTSYGATVGYIYNGWQFLGTYYLNSQQTSGGSTYKGTGWAAELGYIFDIGGIGIGPLISYRSWNYTTKNGTSISPAEKQSSILPMLQIFVSF